MTSGVTIHPVDGDGTLGRIEQFESFEGALASLEGRSGACFVRSLELTAEQASVLARCAARAAPELCIGVIPIDRAPETFLSRERPIGKQYIFDGLRSGLSLPHASTISVGGEAADTSALSAAADVAYFVGHSNGVHADGAMRVLSNCGEAEPAIDVCAPACFCGDECLFADRTFAPRLLGARRIVALTCWGIRLDELYDRRCSVGHSILSLPQLEAYVTTMRAVRASLPELCLFYFLVNRGLPFGEIANRINRARMREGLDAEYLCFGSPVTAVERTVGEGTCEQDGDSADGTFSARPDAAAARTGEFVCALPAAGEHAGRILRVRGDGGVRAAFLDGDHAYFSLPGTEDRPPEIRFGVERLSSLIDYDRLPADLLRDITPAVAFFQLAPGVTPEIREAICARSDALRTWLLDWPFFRQEPGDFLFDAEIASREQELRALIEEFSKAVLIGYQALARNGGPGGAVASGSIWARLGRIVSHATSRCDYCNSVVAEYRYEGSGQLFTRSVAYCDRCGLLRDCDAGSAEGCIVVPPSVPLGGEFTLSVPAENTYAREMAAYAIAFLQASPAKESAASPPVRALLPPRERARLSLTMTPGFRHPGVYALSACALVGTRPSFFRCHVRLEA